MGRSSNPGPPMPRARLRDLGIATGALPPGPLNAITDVDGVRVGCTTVIRDTPHIVRSGVTAIWPRGQEIWTDYVFAGFHSFNGNGEMTGLPWIAEQGYIGAPICITNTYQVGIVRDAICALAVRDGASQAFHLPVVAETYDGWLSDIQSFSLTQADAIAALDSATGGPVREGNVGGGTGMICHEFKGGIGTASRMLDEAAGGWTVGVLVQANYGRRTWLRVDGVPVGEAIPVSEVAGPHRPEDFEGPVPAAAQPPSPPAGSGSIIVIIATRAPLLPHQCERLAQRAGLGIARMGGAGANTSGDLFLCFATGNRSLPHTTWAADPRLVVDVRSVNDHAISGLFDGVIEATEEAILNALIAAETMTGRDGITAHALPHDRLVAVLADHGRPVARG